MTACRCNERSQPLPNAVPCGSNARPRQWFVCRRNESRSAFNGYRKRWSDYSHIQCRVCGAFWKTKADYVAELPDCEHWPQHAPKVEAINAGTS